jgi:tetratricopeptide (TPR) repeat protein
MDYNKPPLPGSVISSRTIAALERAHSLDDGHIRAGQNSSAKEAAAFNLGKVFEKAACHNTAVSWFRRSLHLARSGGVNENVLANVHALAQNLNTLGNYNEARPCYDEMLQILENVPLAQQVSGGLAHAAVYDLQHGDQVRGEAIMRTLRADALQVHSAYFASTRIALWFASALHAFGMHYIATGRARTR